MAAALPQSALLVIPTSSFFNSGLDANPLGSVLDHKGTDFLSPKTILMDAHQVTTNLTNGDNTLGQNPSANLIQKGTMSALVDILKAPTPIGIDTAQFNLFPGALTPVLPGVTSAATTADKTETPVKNVNKTITASPADLLSDLLNYNPLMWMNPTANNIGLGTMDAVNKIAGAGSIFKAPLANGPLFPFFSTTPPTFTNATGPTTTINGSIGGLSAGLFFPISANQVSETLGGLAPDLNTNNPGAPIIPSTPGILGTPRTSANLSNQGLQLLQNLTALLSQFLSTGATLASP
jgi:hypothetical protein